MIRSTNTETLLRVGLAFAFIYPAVSSVLNPYSWVGYIPRFVIETTQLQPMLLLHGFGFFELFLAVWILFARNTLYPGVLAALILSLIVIFNFNQMDVIFRDIPLILVALALAQKDLLFSKPIKQKGSTDV